MQLRLTFVLAALVLALAALNAWMLLGDARERETARLETQLLADTRRAAAWPQHSPLAVPATQGGWVRRVARESGTRVALLDGSGRVLADSALDSAELAHRPPEKDQREIEEALAGRASIAQRPGPARRATLLHAAAPIEPLQGDARGPRVVRLTRDLTEVESAVGAIRRRLLLATSLGLVVAGGFAWIVRRIALGPLEELGDVVSAIAHGELTRRARRGRARDRIGELANSINTMAEQLRVRLGEATAEKERLRAVLASMVEGVLVLDEEGRVVLINPPARELLSVWGEIEGRRPLALVRDPALADALAAAGAKGEVVVTELENFGPEQRSILVHAAGFSADETSSGTVAVFHDVTEIRALEQIRSDFIANASHELRTPLTSIQGFAETLTDSQLTAEQRAQYTEAILRNSRRLGSLIADLLSLSRIESRTAPMHFGEIDISRTCKLIAEDLQARMQEANLECRLQLPEEVLAWADQRAVEQVVSNLLDNAIKYTEPGGRIELGARTEGGLTRVWVADSGIGIPEEDRARIFERFYRVDRARARALGGTGLGLAIVKHLLHAMNGDISVESEPGTGSTFVFRLPRAQPARD